MGTRIATCVLALGALVAALGGASAPAFPPAHDARAFLTTGSAPIPPGFKLRSSNGYTIDLFVLRASAASDSAAFAFIVVRGRTGAVSYFTPATATEGAIEADLGDLGRVAVAFNATGGTTRQRSVCNKDRAYSFASGYYEGTIDFHGEEGYTEVEALRAEGDASQALDIVCPADSTSGTGPGLPGAELRVRTGHTNPAPSLTVVENNPQAPVQLEVNLRERHAEVGIERTIRMRAPREAFDYDAKLRTATLRPPPPFSGTGLFQRIGRRQSRWRGDLTVDLPGRSGVRLTGGHLRASLFRARFKGSGPLE